MGLSAICEASLAVLFLHFICFLLTKPWKLATLESVSLSFELTQFFISLALLWTVLPTLGGHMFLIFFYECQSPRSACEGCQCCNRCGIYSSFFQGGSQHFADSRRRPRPSSGQVFRQLLHCFCFFNRLLLKSHDESWLSIFAWCTFSQYFQVKVPVRVATGSRGQI